MIWRARSINAPDLGSFLQTGPPGRPARHAHTDRPRALVSTCSCRRRTQSRLSLRREAATPGSPGCDSALRERLNEAVKLKLKFISRAGARSRWLMNSPVARGPVCIRLPRKPSRVSPAERLERAAGGGWRAAAAAGSPPGVGRAPSARPARNIAPVRGLPRASELPKRKQSIGGRRKRVLFARPNGRRQLVRLTASVGWATPLAACARSSLHASRPISTLD